MVKPTVTDHGAYETVTLTGSEYMALIAGNESCKRKLDDTQRTLDATTIEWDRTRAQNAALREALAAICDDRETLLNPDLWKQARAALAEGGAAKAIRESENESDTSPLTPYGEALERIGQLRQALSWVIDEASVLGLDRMPGDTMGDFCKACHEARAVLDDGDAVAGGE